MFPSTGSFPTVSSADADISLTRIFEMGLTPTANRIGTTVLPARAVPGPDSAGPHWSRPNVVALLERPIPGSWSLRQLSSFARRWGAHLLIATVVTYDHTLNDFDRVRFLMAKKDVADVTARLVEQGIGAAGEVRLAAHGDEVSAASDLADRLDADLVIVLARRGSWFGLFPGSALAHRLMRQGRRPVLVIPDHGRRRRRLRVLVGLVRVRAPHV